MPSLPSLPLNYTHSLSPSLSLDALVHILLLRNAAQANRRLKSKRRLCSTLKWPRGKTPPKATVAPISLADQPHALLEALFSYCTCTATTLERSLISADQLNSVLPLRNHHPRCDRHGHQLLEKQLACIGHRHLVDLVVHANLLAVGAVEGTLLEVSHRDHSTRGADVHPVRVGIEEKPILEEVCSTM